MGIEAGVLSLAPEKYQGVKNVSNFDTTALFLIITLYRLRSEESHAGLEILPKL